jgi:hypothetical protein
MEAMTRSFLVQLKKNQVTPGTQYISIAYKHQARFLRLSRRLPGAHKSAFLGQFGN